MSDRRAESRASADGYRSSGEGAIALSITAARAGESPGAARITGAGLESIFAARSPSHGVRANGASPVASL